MLEEKTSDDAPFASNEACLAWARGWNDARLHRPVLLDVHDTLGKVIEDYAVRMTRLINERDDLIAHKHRHGADLDDEIAECNEELQARAEILRDMAPLLVQARELWERAAQVELLFVRLPAAVNRAFTMPQRVMGTIVGQCDVCGAPATQRDPGDNERCNRHRLTTGDMSY